jgi:hypothetical protein
MPSIITFNVGVRDSLESFENLTIYLLGNINKSFIVALNNIIFDSTLSGNLIIKYSINRKALNTLVYMFLGIKSGD